MRQSLRVIAASLAILVCAFFPRPASADRPHLTVGAILPLSGSSAEFGQSARAAIELAVEQLPPEDRGRVKVIFEDDGLVSSRSVSAGRKLIDIDRVDALITWSSSTALSLVGVTESRKIPHIAIASDPAVSRGKRYTFTYWALPEDEARLVYDYLARQGRKRLGILAVTHNGILANRYALEGLIRERGGLSVVASEEVSDATLDFRAVLERMKGRGPLDAFIPMFFPGQLAVAVRQARAIGLDVPIVGFETFEDKAEISAAQGLFSGAVFATGADPKPEFVRAFHAKLPEGSLYTASNSYDALALLAQATRDGVDSERVAEFLRGVRDLPVASGCVSATVDNRFKLPTVLKTVGADGQVRLVEGRRHDLAHAE